MSSRTGRWVDAALALLLFAVTVVYLAALPRNLSVPDEAHALHEATRVLDGEVMYRDIFELILPGWMYLMAALFWLFGTTLSTARITAAVIHGGIAVVMFLICRRLFVRRALASACAFTYLIVCPPLFPVASQHWLSTFLSIILLAMCLRSVHGMRWSVAIGVVVGLLIAVHHQRGVSMGVGVAAFLVADAVVRRRYGGHADVTVLTQRLIGLVGGTLLVVVPLLLGLARSAGIEPVWRALVIQPLMNYRGAVSARWGHAIWGIEKAPFAFPRLLTYLPVALLLSVLSLLVLYYRRHDLEHARALTLLAVFCVFSMISIAYFPDIIHIAFIAPVFFVTGAEAIERALRLLPTRLGHGLGYVLSSAIALGGGLQLQQNLMRLREQYPVRYASEFGEIALPGPYYARLLEQLKELLRGVPSRTLYCHPRSAYTYLLVDAHNPTRFSFVIPPVYTGPDQVQEVIATLAAKRVPYVLAHDTSKQHEDLISRFIQQHYERRPGPKPLADVIWHRKSDTAARP